MRRIEAAPTAIGSELLWHLTECGGYGGDLALWERLAAAAGDPVLDLGAGAGRVALHLGSRGHRVVAVDRDADLLAAAAAEAADRALPVSTLVADVREFETDRRYPLIIAPMQLMHLMGGPEQRRRAIAAAAAALEPGGLFAAALLDDRASLAAGPAEPLPDVRERDGWVHSSLPLEVRVDPERIEVRRLRQIVSPTGELFERAHSVWFDRLTPGELEAEATVAGLVPEERIELPETDEHVSSIVVRLRAPEEGA